MTDKITGKEAWDALGKLEMYCRQHAKNCMGCRFEDSRGCHMRNTVTMFTSELVGGISDMEAVLMAKALREHCGNLYDTYGFAGSYDHDD